MANNNPELSRINISLDNKGWKRFGPYLSERQWGTVREDYSAFGDAWGYLPHEKARSTAYRWGEDGIGGLADHKQNFCFALALWNGNDPILKERLYGLSNPEGNHGEDVKELYYYLDSTPTHSYMKMLYKYPQREFPYNHLLTENRKRSRAESEYELLDTGVFDKDQYFDVFVEYAKAHIDDILVKITVHNRYSQKAPLSVLPTAWYRNVWAWTNDPERPLIRDVNHCHHVHLKYTNFPDYYICYEKNAETIFCDNETNPFKPGNKGKKYYKDGINNYVVNSDMDAVNPEKSGTKCAFLHQLELEGGQSAEVRLRFTRYPDKAFEDFDAIFELRKQEADIFYDDVQKHVQHPDLKKVQRQAFAGMMWSKQFYSYEVNRWLEGDAAVSRMSDNRKNGRNHDWRHLVNNNIISMPDKWEYPWYAAWDLAFHAVPLARLDPFFAKRQLLLMLREYYMHPNGQIPAYEWNFSDVNPPVHAWGAWKVYTIDKEMNGKPDLEFLEKIFHKLLMNFTWWVNRKDSSGNNLFQGGFLGLDNIGVFDRSHSLPTGGHLEQADSTAWMAMYCLNMLRIALEISQERPYYQEMASKFFEHFLAISKAMFNIGRENADLWDDTDEFYYDVVHPVGSPGHVLKVRSIVGIIPLFAVEVLQPELLAKLPDFARRLQWVLRNRPDLSSLVSRWYEHGKGETRMLSLVRVHRLKSILKRMLSEDEFLSDYGIRALSKYHDKHPYEYNVNGETFSVKYLPGESDSSMFGGNSNWRGPVWFPINFMIVESLNKFYEYYGDSLKVEFPTGSGNFMALNEIAHKITRRLVNIFALDKNGKRAYTKGADKFNTDPHFREHLLFYEYFHGDSGKGLGASHQTGWTGLVSELINYTSKFKYAPDGNYRTSI